MGRQPRPRIQRQRGRRQPHHERGEEPQFQRRAIQDERQVRPAVVEDHDLVDHGQFEVRVGIVRRHTAVLDQGHHCEGGRRQPEPQPGLSPRGGRQIGVHARQRQGPARPGHREQGQEQDGFGDGGESDLAAGAHALETGAGVQGRQDGEQPGQPEQVEDQDEIAGEREEGAALAKGDQRGRGQHRAQPDRRAGAEEPRRRPAVDGALAEKPGQVVVRLHRRGAATPGEPGLGAVDHPEQQRRQQQRQKDLDEFERRHGIALRPVSRAAGSAVSRQCRARTGGPGRAGTAAGRTVRARPLRGRVR
ncbi:MAG: hypothetical protein BWZ02_03288 [Lentisphaerae bacterium ADurb.BinA184]|nr:MAG: hypothetical protein BWZ02_03288 [Lentisphaerae bacterium ADurb.BinA184]